MKKTEYKKRIDDFLVLNWDFLLKCARNCLIGKKTSHNDLVGELTLYLYDNQTKVQPYFEDENNSNAILAFSISWLKLQATHNTTPYSRKFQSRSNEGEIPEVASIAEPEDTLEEDYIKDLRNIYTDKQIERILKINDIYPTLSKVNKILFKAYFVEDLSYDKIKEKYDFFRTDKNGKRIYYKSKKSIYNLMVELKNEIRKNL